MYDKIITELSSAVSVSAQDASTDEFYNIERDCTPSEKTKVQTLLSQYGNALEGLIKQGITRAVLLCADTQDKALKSYTRMEGDEVDAWRKDTAKAFMQSRMKRDKGLNLSDRVWNYTQQTKSEFELAMSHALEDGISKGISAESLGRKVRQYLNNPDMMYRRYHTKKLMSDGTKKDVVEWRRRVIDEDGKVHFVKYDLAKVGAGVYRSARQNALRLTITETNMAYDFANCTRWANEPFVLGLRIRLSDNHPEEDICDDLQGDYPKTFMWRGWHPRCMCSISPILMDRKSEEWKKLRAMSDEDYKKYQSPNLVKSVPKKFKTWCDTNKDKLNAAREKGKLPYFVRDNEQIVGDIVGWEKPILHTLSESNSEKLEKSINRTRKMLVRQDREKMVVLNSKGVPIVEQVGTSSNVHFDDETARLARNAIVTHNHPTGKDEKGFLRYGYSLSSDDVFEAIRCNTRKLIAEAPYYRYFIERPTNGWNVDAEVAKKRYYEVYKNIKIRYSDLLEKYDIKNIVQHLTMKALAKEFGFVYRYEKKD